MDGARLECRAWGPPPHEAPTIVLLHEGLGSMALWRDFPNRLAEATGHGVFAFSRLGYGRSDACALPRPLDFMTHEAVDVLPRVLDAIGFRRGLIVGHSDGASIAAIHAGTVADPRVTGIVLIAPHFFTEPMGLAEIAKARQAFDHGDLRTRLARYHDHVDAAFRGWNDVWLHPDFASWQITEPLSRIDRPVLAIQGRGDQYGTLAQIEIVRELARGPVELAVLEDCRHACHIEQPERLMTLVAGFAERFAGQGARPLVATHRESKP
ncbi:MAG: alpha/beta fold hydrolase [Rhizobiales bacterium]|nr:alpha/beta fold hydrolase [Hyphomicrobiales bacterium]